MEFTFLENLRYWKQGFFLFGTQKRVATVTDVKFIDDKKFFVAHRAAAKLFLIEIHDNVKTILDCLLIKKCSNRFFHPDLISYKNNTIFMTDYSNTACMARLDNATNKLNIVKFFKIHDLVEYHGCLFHNNLVYFGGTKSTDNNTPLSIYNMDTAKIEHIKINFDRRIKSINAFEKKLLLCVDNGPSQHLHDSWIMFFNIVDSKLALIDSIYLKNSQVDGSVMYNNHLFVALHCANDKCGYIYIVKVNEHDSQKLSFVKKVKCKNFPHGIDIYNNKLVYSSYTNSSITVHSLADFI